ncbi:FHA domain-containing protein [Singulisphaera acidiphila]|uniref:FHA domain-containing protein n=1 Tax=Singulisphaera acidiphila (strain ATCC BAA-1392 / DSM 18658 / VKM B-2454 / MOB10) TaxID=886293 RepID=L0DNQ2_SINAD|nr:FHA domain-containing protein [Singulisphaera acidiphila]AGA30478.1 FHA domain-containing protein [Singulisphaera acidiphila DSM 18658]
MTSDTKVLGILTPTGGGDPISLLKAEVVVGRRASCDICLDFTNVSGKHCVLRLVNSVWHVRDLGSTNGTTVNGSQIASEHSIMPDDEVGIASHFFTIDYEPGGPVGIFSKDQLLDEDIAETKKRHSLMELAGLDTDDNKPKHRSRATHAPETIERPSVDEADFDDALPDDFKIAPAPIIEANDDDFLKLIQEDVEKLKP